MSSGRDLLLSGGKKPFCPPLRVPVPPSPSGPLPPLSLPPQTAFTNSFLTIGFSPPPPERATRLQPPPPPFPPSLPSPHSRDPPDPRSPGKRTQSPLLSFSDPVTIWGTGTQASIPSLQTPAREALSPAWSRLRPTPAGPSPSSPRPPFFSPFFLSPFPFSSLPRWPKWVPPFNDLASPRPPPLCAAAPEPCSRGSEGGGVPRQPRGFGAPRWGGSLSPWPSPTS